MKTINHDSRLLAIVLSGSVVLGMAVAAGAQTTVASTPVGVVSAALPRGETGLAFPLTTGDVFVGVVEANAGTSLAFDAAHGNIGALLDANRPYYVEVLTGSLEGERLDVNTAATRELGGAGVVLALGNGSHSTLSAVADDALAGARVGLRPHVTLADVQAAFSPALTGNDVADRADGIWLWTGSRFHFYHLASDNAAWLRHGSGLDVRNTIIPPDVSVLVEVRSTGKTFVHAGSVRVNDFRTNLAAEAQAFATGFPVDLTPLQARAFVDPTAPAATRWTGNVSPAKADQIGVFSTTTDSLVVYLAADGTTWRTPNSPTDLSNTPLLRALGMVVVKRKKADPTYRIPVPF